MSSYVSCQRSQWLYLNARADPEQCCWGGARTGGGVRPRQREALAEGAAAGVWGAKIGLLES